MNRTVRIVRGLPGSGKSTWVKKASLRLMDDGQTVVVCSSDKFFECPCCKGYNWNRDKLRFAHAWCRETFENALKEGIENVFVDNTNVTLREIRPYVTLAEAYGYDIEIVEPNTPWAFDVDELVRRNIHHVPREGIERMLSRWVPDVTVEMALAYTDYSLRKDATEDEKASVRGVNS